MLNLRIGWLWPSRGLLTGFGLAVLATISLTGLSGSTHAATPECGIASWYGGKWAGVKTASGEIYDPSTMTAAHRTLEFGQRVRVVERSTGRSVVVRINNRGPFKRGRVIDLSEEAATRLGFKADGLTDVCVELLG